jgi:hypothetical protein
LTRNEPGSNKNQGLFLVASPKERRAAASAAFEALRAKDTQALEDLTQELMRQYQPVGATETLLVQDMARYMRRKEYALSLQTQVGEKGLPALERLHKTNDVSLSMAVNSLKKLQKVRAKEEARRPKLTVVAKVKRSGEG